MSLVPSVAVLFAGGRSRGHARSQFVSSHRYPKARWHAAVNQGGAKWTPMHHQQPQPQQQHALRVVHNTKTHRGGGELAADIGSTEHRERRANGKVPMTGLVHIMSNEALLMACGDGMDDYGEPLYQAADNNAVSPPSCRLDPGGDRRRSSANVFDMRTVQMWLEHGCDMYDESFYGNGKPFVPQQAHYTPAVCSPMEGAGAFANCAPMAGAGGGGVGGGAVRLRQHVAPVMDSAALCAGYGQVEMNVNNVHTTLDARGICTVVLGQHLSYKLLWHLTPVRHTSSAGYSAPASAIVTDTSDAENVRPNNGSGGFVAGAKYYLPLELCKPPDNLVGRLLGPSGITVKRLEQTTGCKIVLCGRGSVKNAAKEARLVGKPGWEHLDEPLHVLVEATEQCDNEVRRVLEKGVCTVSEVLTPVGNDEFKRQQLVELAIMNGTYRATRRSQAVVPNGNYRKQINLRYDEEGSCPYNVMRQMHQQHVRKQRITAATATANVNTNSKEEAGDGGGAKAACANA